MRVNHCIIQHFKASLVTKFFTLFIQNKDLHKSHLHVKFPNRVTYRQLLCSAYSLPDNSWPLIGRRARPPWLIVRAEEGGGDVQPSRVRHSFSLKAKLSETREIFLPWSEKNSLFSLVRLQAKHFKTAKNLKQTWRNKWKIAIPVKVERFSSNI